MKFLHNYETADSASCTLSEGHFKVAAALLPATWCIHCKEFIYVQFSTPQRGGLMVMTKGMKGKHLCKLQIESTFV